MASAKVRHHTFTYFIPSPPGRKSGYREREFDKIMHGILLSGFEIIEIQTQSCSTGIFVIALLKAKSKKISDMDKDFDIQEHFRLSHKHASSDIILDNEDA